MDKDKRYQVFVSSTFTDLQEERRAVMQTLMEMDCMPAGMELFPALDEEQFAFIKKIIEDCDYYIIIIGGRYGSLSESGISYTELEYDYAVSLGIKVIALVHKDPDAIPARHVEASEELKNRLKIFREKVSTGRLVKFWDSSDQISGLVALSLNRTIKTYPATGWVRADELEKAVKAEKELSNTLKLPGLLAGVEEIFSSRKSLGAYFSEVTASAQISVVSFFVTGGFIPPVELEELIADNPSVSYTFLVIDPNSSFREERGEDTKVRFQVGKAGDGYNHLFEAKEKHPERVFIKSYDQYPFWHYVLIDEDTIYVSYNPIGRIGFSSCPVYKFIRTSDEKSLFNAHYEHLKVIERSASVWN